MSETNKSSLPDQSTPAPTARSSDEPLPIISFVLGIASLFGPGLFFGIPAIVIAAIALRKQQGNRGFSLTGLITGIVSTVGSLLLIGFIILLIFIGLTAPVQPQAEPGQSEEQQLFNSAQL